MGRVGLDGHEVHGTPAQRPAAGAKLRANDGETGLVGARGGQRAATFCRNSRRESQRPPSWRRGAKRAIESLLTDREEAVAATHSCEGEGGAGQTDKDGIAASCVYNDNTSASTSGRIEREAGTVALAQACAEDWLLGRVQMHSVRTYRQRSEGRPRTGC